MASNRNALLGLCCAAAVIVAGIEGVALLRLWRQTEAHETEQEAPATDAAEHEAEKQAGTTDDGIIHLGDERADQSGVHCSPAVPGTLTEYLTLSGEVRLNDDKTIQSTSPVAGVVKSVAVALGDRVDSGALLLTLSSRELAAARSALLSARTRMQLADETFQREKRLWERKISAEQDYLQAKQALSEAQIAVREAEQQLRTLGANEPGASGDLSLFEIKAPLTGTIVAKSVVAGANVDAGTALFTISDLNSVWIDLDVRPESLAQVQIGQQVMLSLNDSPSDRHGELSYIGPLLGNESRTAKARIVLDNSEGYWRAGQFVYGLLPVQESQARVMLPAVAVQTVAGAPMVFVKVSEGFRSQIVKLGRKSGDSVEITAGVEPGDCVVTEGSFVLKAEMGKNAASHDDE